MPQGLPVSRLINVTVSLSPTAAPNLNFDTLLIVGNTNVINVTDRIRTYNTLGAVGTDFGLSAPEYLAAALYFAQNPQPAVLYIGRWAQTATAGLLVGGVLTAAQQMLSVFTAITNGGFKLAVDGGAVTNVTGLNFSGAANLNAVAAIIQTGVRALAGAFANVTVTWNSVYSQFTFASGTTGASSSVSALTAPTANTDISATLAGTAATLSELVPGIAAESAAACAAIMDNQRISFYALMFASPSIVDADHLAIAAYIEGSGNPHVYGLTTSETAALLTTDASSIGYQLKQLGYNRTCYQFSSTSPYAIASFFGRAMTVDFTGSNTTITMMYQTEPGVVPENLSSSQAGALDANNYNYFVGFNNGSSIIVNGKMASGQFFDTIFGTDWLANDIQTSIFNLLAGSKTKIPQTDAGNNQIVTVIAAACAQGVVNGLLAPGQWNAPGFGNLATGQYLPTGYYIYAPPIATQNQSDRANRKSVLFQVAAKGAGAIHNVNVGIAFNS